MATTDEKPQVVNQKDIDNLVVESAVRGPRAAAAEAARRNAERDARRR